MTIILDAHGGDNAPPAVLRGCAEASEKYGAQILLCGDREAISHCAAENNIPMEGCEILDSSADKSITTGLEALAVGIAGAFVSAGSTGLLVTEANRVLGRRPGIRRAAIAAVMPSAKEPFVLIDSGANIRCTPEVLLQFAQMGAEYASKAFNIEAPRVGLLNIGTEPDKGDDLHREAYALLQNRSHTNAPLPEGGCPEGTGGSSLNFIGNAEAREVSFGCCDVLVADGFSGNIFLKAYEGTALALIDSLKQIYKQNAFTKLSALLVKKGLTELSRSMDYAQYGGAPLLGFNGTVIKAHGASDARAIRSAIRQAMSIFTHHVRESTRTDKKY